MKRPITVPIIATGVLLLTTVGVAAASAGQSTSVPANAAVATPASGSMQQVAAPAYPRNANGMTYGSELDAASPDQAPDLIAAIATNGRRGYVRKDDLYPQLPTNPIAAVEAQAGQGIRRVPVFREDGLTAIGEFVIGPPGHQAP